MTRQASVRSASRPMPVRAWAVGAFCAGLLALASPAPAFAANFKIAYWNIKSGKGQIALPGHPSTFADTTNCTNSALPLNAWGMKLVQQELLTSVAGDPEIVALGLAEAWTCATPEAVRAVLGWKATIPERNGVSIVARYGFAGPAQWTQLDTSLTANPSDTMWVVRTPVCVDAACAASIDIFTPHWGGSDSPPEFDIQAQQTVDFMSTAPPLEPHVLVGDLNVFEGTVVVCSQTPQNTALTTLRTAGYVDAWPTVNGSAEGYTGMANRAGCGVPIGNTWKRIDYAWSKNLAPVSMTRFGVRPGGDETPSDHYGIIVEYPLPPSTIDTIAPSAAITAPVANTTVSGTVKTRTTASDDRGVARVELYVDDVLAGRATVSPYEIGWNTTTATNGPHALQARAYDAAGNVGMSATCWVSVNNPTSPPPPGPVDAGDIVLYAASPSKIAGTWRIVADSAAAGGARIEQPDAGAPKVATPLASPVNYFELTFTAQANVPYRLWVRGRAHNDSYNNDSVYVQFSGSVTDTGSPVNRIGSAQAATIVLEDCSGCGVAGWGWQDDGYGLNTLGPLMYFTGGPQTIRIQEREDGMAIDQIVVSASAYLLSSPGLTKNDTTILAATSTPPPPVTTGTIVRYAAAATSMVGSWRLVADVTAAGGQRIEQPDAGAAKVATPLANPANYFELTFTAEADKPYRLWIRGHAQADSYNNDSVYVQFSGSVTATGSPIDRIGTTEAMSVILEDCSGCGVAGWGWQDTGYGIGVLGPALYFTAGPQTIRIQQREDGISIDQIVLSPDAYLARSPGSTKNDSTILSQSP